MVVCCVIQTTSLNINYIVNIYVHQLKENLIKTMSCHVIGLKAQIYSIYLILVVNAHILKIACFCLMSIELINKL